jgi:hypothetical protein
MAIKLEDKTNVVAPNATYPYGKIRDNSGSSNGTPVNEQVYGDFHQFFAKMLAESGITANGLPDNQTNGFQYFEALLKLFYRQEARSLITTSTGFTIASSSFLSSVQISGKAKRDGNNVSISINVFGIKTATGGYSWVINVPSAYQISDGVEMSVYYHNGQVVDIFGVSGVVFNVDGTITINAGSDANALNGQSVRVSVFISGIAKNNA